MSVEITEAMKRAYSDNFVTMMQQKESVLEGTAAETKQPMAKAVSFDRIGKATSRLRTSRHSDTYNVDTPHSRRWAVLATYDWGDMIDTNDKLKVITDPQGAYIQVGSSALKRDRDDVIIAALRGTAVTGEEATTSVVLPTSQKISEGGAGLTPGKILTSLEMLNLKDADPDEEKIYVIGPKQVTNLLSQQELTSGDYVQLKALLDGKIVRWAGFNFKMSNRLILSGTTRYCLAYLRARAFGFAVNQDLVTKAETRADKSFSVQCFASQEIGAVRIEEEAVIEVACSEA